MKGVFTGYAVAMVTLSVTKMAMTCLQRLVICLIPLLWRQLKNGISIDLLLKNAGNGCEPPQVYP